MREPKRTAVVRALAGLGDMLCAIPALRALRGAFPRTEIVLIGVPEGIRTAQRFPQYIDRTVELPGWACLPEAKPRPQAMPTFNAALADGFDLAIQMHGSGEVSNELTAALGARVTAGYSLPGHWQPNPEHYLTWTGRQHEVRRWLNLMEHLDVPLRGEFLEFPILEEDRKRMCRLATIHGLLPFSYVCVHPGAGAVTRRWPPERFAAVANAVAERGYRVVLTGSGNERPITDAVRKAMAPALQPNVVDLTGETDLGTLGALLEQARLLVCNDTGVSHVSAALGVPSVIVFSASDPVRWAPSNGRLHRVVTDGSIGSRPRRRHPSSLDKAITEATALLKQQPRCRSSMTQDFGLAASHAARDVASVGGRGGV